MSQDDINRTPIADEIAKRERQDALEEAYDEDDPQRRVRSAHADDLVAEELGKDAVRELTQGEHAAGERDRLNPATTGAIEAQADVIAPSVIDEEPIPVAAGTPTGIAVLLGPGFEDVELTEPVARLREAGYPVEILGTEAGQTLEGKRGKAQVQTDAAVSDREPARFAGLMIPGGFSPDRLRTDPGMVDFVRRFAALDRPIAAVCHGPQLLIEAGTVAGRRMTSWPSVRTDLENAGAEVLDAEVVVDGQLITSRKPEDLPAFSNAFLDALDAVTPDQAIK